MLDIKNSRHHLHQKKGKVVSPSSEEFFSGEGSGSAFTFWTWGDKKKRKLHSGASALQGNSKRGSFDTFVLKVQTRRDRFWPNALKSDTIANVCTHLHAVATFRAFDNFFAKIVSWKGRRVIISQELRLKNMKLLELDMHRRSNKKNSIF